MCCLGKQVVALCGEDVLWTVRTSSTVSAAAVGADVAFGGSANGEVRCWSLDDGVERWQIAQNGSVDAMCVCTETVICCLATDEGGAVRCLGIEDGAERWAGVHDMPVSAVAFCSGTVVTGGNDLAVKCWAEADGTLKWTGGAHKDWVIHVAPSSNACAVSASLDNSIVCWGVDQGSMVWQSPGHTEGIVCLVAKFGAVISGSKDATVRCWDPETGAMVWEYEADDEVCAVDISEDCAAIVCKNGRMCGLGLASGSVLWSMQTASGSSTVSTVRFMAGGRFACAGTGLLSIYETAK